MKKRFAAIVAALAIMATGAASMGCVWILVDEPKTCKSFND